MADPAADRLVHDLAALLGVPERQSGLVSRGSRPAAFFAVVLWIIASALFALYVSNFSSYNKTYGSLGGVIVFLIWLWITNIIILSGAELNSEMERSKAIQEGHPPGRSPSCRCATTEESKTERVHARVALAHHHVDHAGAEVVGHDQRVFELDAAQHVRAAPASVAAPPPCAVPVAIIGRRAAGEREVRHHSARGLHLDTSATYSITALAPVASATR